jgi:hypothetical protein
MISIGDGGPDYEEIGHRIFVVQGVRILNRDLAWLAMPWFE